MDRNKEPLLVTIHHVDSDTVVSFKGCSLQCPWCPTPEVISPRLEIICDKERCIACGECVHGCPQHAITLDTTTPLRDNDKCNLCLNCVEICPSLVFSTVGERYSCKQVMEQIESHLPTQNQTSSSVFFTGGEPLSQPSSLIHLLDECAKLPVRRVVSTSGFVPTTVLLDVAKRTDLFLYTVRHMNPVTHQHMTGQSNDLILHNLRKLDAIGAAVQIRVFLIEGVNDDEENIKTIGAFLKTLETINTVQLLSYDDLQPPYARNITDRRPRLHPSTPEARYMVRARAIFEEYDLLVTSETE